MSRPTLTCVFHMSKMHEKETTQDGRRHARTPTSNAHISLACKLFSSSQSYSRPCTYCSAFPSCYGWHLLDGSHSGTHTHTHTHTERERAREGSHRMARMHMHTAQGAAAPRLGTWGIYLHEIAPCLSTRQREALLGGRGLTYFFLAPISSCLRAGRTGIRREAQPLWDRGASG